MTTANDSPPASDELEGSGQPEEKPTPHSGTSRSRGDWFTLLWLLGCFVFMWLLGILTMLRGN